MAITAAHLIYDVVEMASSGGNPNEFKISNEQILYWVEEIRAQLIAQSLAKRDDVNDSWVQYINCVELEQVSAAECCLVESDCYILRSKKRMPATIDTWKDNWIISVTTMDGTSIPKSNPIKQRYQKYNKYTGSKRSWFIKDDYLYVLNDQVLTYVTVAGLFETPSDLAEFISCEGEACWTLDSHYPISLNMAGQITDIIMKTKVNPFMNYPMDNKNDANGGTPQQNIQNKQAEQ